MSKGRLSPRDLADAMVAFRGSLQTHQGTINRLNVFPVPDGDTGTNMLLTLESVCSALADLPSDPAMAAVCEAVGTGSLMGARGNSGVILCQILRALTTSAGQSAALGPAELATAIGEASEAARRAVSRPVEGTILTVVGGAAERAAAASAAGADLTAVIEAAREGARDALASTPTLLQVLADAGVVDAGGAGLSLLFPALLHVVDGRPLPDELDLPEDVAAIVAGAALTTVPPLVTDGEDDGPRYEVMYLLDAKDAAIEALRARFDEIGDSTVIVGETPMFSCHVHTDDIGAAIEAGIAAGRPHDIRVTDLREQVEEERWVRDAAVGTHEPPPFTEPPRTSVVAVATGAGVRRIFTSLGVARLVAGGQSMNPSTADILDMTEAAPGREVVLLPNNKNILPVAEQVVALSSKPVRVVPTLGVQEGFAALLAYDPGASSEDNAAAMGAAAANVVAGEITQAVRDSNGPTGPISEGAWLGLSREGIEVVEESLVGAARALIERLLQPDHEIVTLIEGNGAERVEIAEIERWLEKEHPELSVERHLGGQPLYPLLVSIE